LKKDGEKILTNYKKQLAEKLAREHAEAGGLASRKSRPTTEEKSRSSFQGNTMYSKKSQNAESDYTKLLSQKMQEISSFTGDPPEPEVLLAILNKKTNFD